MIVFMYIRQREPAKIVSKEWKLTIVFLRGLNVVSPDDNGGKLSYTLNGTLYPNEQVVIYDIGDVKPETEKKRRGRRKKSEIEAEQKEN